jgi:arginine deiminase
MIHVYSEIGRLQSVLLHRPSKELEQLTPDLLERLLFDDIPYLKVAQQEHDAFASVLKEQGVRVLYIEDLLEETLENVPQKKEELITQFVNESNVKSRHATASVISYLMSLNDKDLIKTMIKGIRTKELETESGSKLLDALDEDYPFYTDPMPNLLFQRDPFVTIGQGVCINHMMSGARDRETLLSEFVLSHHPSLKQDPLKIYKRRTSRWKSEGGDILILSSKVILAGLSQRTEPRAIEALARTLFESEETFEQVIVVNIPKSRAFMHLDTIMTQVDFDKFLVHPAALNPYHILSIVKTADGYDIIEEDSSIENVLELALKRPLKFIQIGGTDLITTNREQWNDGANTLCIRPGVVVAYERNHVTNELLRKNGVTVLEIPSSELSRGRGGPRCMSMPLLRDDLDE